MADLDDLRRPMLTDAHPRPKALRPPYRARTSRSISASSTERGCERRANSVDGGRYDDVLSFVESSEGRSDRKR